MHWPVSWGLDVEEGAEAVPIKVGENVVAARLHKPGFR